MKTIKNKLDAELAMNALALVTNNRRKFATRIDAEKIAVEKKYAGNLEACDQTITELESSLRVWAEANPDEFGKKKSIKFGSGVIGFRDGKLKLVLASKTWSWERALEAVEHFLPNFIRQHPEIDKDAIINQHEELSPALVKCGLKVEQAERFYAKPNLIEVEPE